MSSKEITLLEETLQMSGPNNFEILQTTRCFLGQSPDTTHEGGYQTTFKLGVYNVRVCKVDPRKLLDCKIESKSPVARLLTKRRFHMVYETHVAEKVTCNVKLSEIKARNNVLKKWTLKECPVIFRFVELCVDRQGVVKDLRFNVTRHELLKVKGHVIMPSMKLLA